jgi:hypothetical protein
MDNPDNASNVLLIEEGGEYQHQIGKSLITQMIGYKLSSSK